MTGPVDPAGPRVRALVLAKSGVAKSIEGGKTYFGYPAGEANEKLRELASLRHLPGMLSKAKQE